MNIINGGITMIEKKDTQETINELEAELNIEAEIKRLRCITIKLSKPFTYEGKTYEEITMDFEGLTGRDIEAIDDELAAFGIVIPNPNISHKYQRLLAARAAGVPSDMLNALPAQDYNKITFTARRFLLATA